MGKIEHAKQVINNHKFDLETLKINAGKLAGEYINAIDNGEIKKAIAKADIMLEHANDIKLLAHLIELLENELFAMEHDPKVISAEHDYFD